jgi:hypothetical protein
LFHYVLILVLTFFHDHAVAEVGIKKLRNALKILSETEKQLRTSRNQATWVTVALLQFGTNESSLVAETNDLHAHTVTGYTGKCSVCMQIPIPCNYNIFIAEWQPFLLSLCADDWVSKVNSNSHFCHACNSNKSNCSERHCRRLKLENIWKRAIGKCRSRSAKSFLRKEGFLSSVHVTEGKHLYHLYCISIH